MAEEPMFSSQGSHYDHHRILHDEQENIPSSPPISSQHSPRRTSPRIHKSNIDKPKGLPTVTPKRFTKFFTPRNTLSGRGGRQSKAARTLKDITKNGANRRRTTEPIADDLLGSVHYYDDRPSKRRKTTLDISSSPPQSSPLKHIQSANPESIYIQVDEAASPCVTEEDELPDLLAQLKPFPQPIRRMRQIGQPRRILQRSFGGYDATSRGWKGTDHCASWQNETANFVSTPNDVHSFRGSATPFCTASCNTNSLIAIGDELGSIHLVDSSRETAFSQAHVSFKVHSNAIIDMAFSSDDYILASASGDQTARVVDMQTQSVLCILSGHGSSVKQIRFQPGSDNVITTSSRDGTVRLWDLRCSERGSVASLRLGQKQCLNEDGIEEPSVRYPTESLLVGPAHRSVKGTAIPSPHVLKSEEASVSITAIQHLPNGREHLLLTASELSASIKLWDLRNARSRNAIPLASTPLPAPHRKTRNYGVNSMVLSADGARMYTLCRDATVYAYSTNHILLGSSPEMNTNSRRRAPKDSKLGLGPLYGFRHPALRTESFYVKAALRPAQRDGSEILAVGSSEGSTVVFPTDERHLQRKDIADDDDELPSPPSPTSTLPIYEQGTPLVRGHGKEVSSLAWTHDGELVTIADDLTARCWREDAQQARHLRQCGEGGGQRWGHGWADVADADWDVEDE